MIDDPLKPYKAWAAIASAFISTLLLTEGTSLPAWAVGLLTALLAGLSVFFVTNPKK